MTPRRAVALAFATIGFVTACGSSPLRLKPAHVPKVAAPGPAGPDRLRVATFNAGLAVGYLPRSAERAPRVVSALAAEKLDLLCVQEVWLEEHWNDLKRRTSEQLPYTIRPSPRAPANERSCTGAELAPAAVCALRHCSGKPTERAAECALKKCKKHVRALSPSCMSCLSRDPLRRISEILEECVDPSEADPRASVSEKDFRFFGGSYGTGLLSSRPLLEQTRFELESVHHPRAVLHAKVDAGGSALHVFCTYLTPILGSLEHPGGGSWEEEQAHQVEAMLGFVDREAGREPALVLGDLNTGPASPPDVRPRTESTYAVFERAGFSNAYLASGQHRCTFCYDNPVAGGKNHDGLIIDHVLLRNFRGRASAQRFLDRLIEIDVGGKRETTALSDHYGVVADLVF